MAGFGNYAAALILLTFTHNTFAYDGRGLLNLMNAPITPEQLIRAKARVHQLVSLGAGVLASLFCWLYVAPSASAGWVCVAIMGVLVVVPIVTTVGLWVSVQYPIKFDASLNRRERQPLLVSIAGFAGVLLGSIPLLIAVRFIQAGGALDSALLTLIVAALLVWFIHCKMLVRISLAFSRRQSEVLSAITRV
ncbi:MAG: hypothetical protein CSA49_06015 [Gammaproteobacteria bacterium]|nr:MAG: hypothetical protein CSA49_06015 [Gammaproteobacteria bacterium]